MFYDKTERQSLHNDTEKQTRNPEQEGSTDKTPSKKSGG